MRASALCGFADAQKVLKGAVINANVTDPLHCLPFLSYPSLLSLEVGAEGHQIADIANFVPSHPCNNKSNEWCNSCPALCANRPCLCLL